MTDERIRIPPAYTATCETPCRIWQGRLSSHGHRGSGGYGVRSVKGKDIYLHRWVWEQINGPIPKGMEIMHLCDNRACFRYDHLRMGTHAENMADATTKGRMRPGPGRPFAPGYDPRRRGGQK